MVEVINVSNKYEEIMDKTDFDSWLKTDTEQKLDLDYPEQNIHPFRIFKDNIAELKKILQKKSTLNEELDETNPNFSKEKDLIDRFFIAKETRLEARLNYDDEETYQKLRSGLFDSINVLQPMDFDSFPNKTYWLVLFNNELSICYAGLRNSSLSRGYAEEARKIIEKEESYQEFEKQLLEKRSDRKINVKELVFVTSELYSLYTISLFNQAEAERRSYLYGDAEKNFMKIITYVKENPELMNYNYFSAINSLSELYIDQGRGKEALDFLKKIVEPKEVYSLKSDDKRYWIAFLEYVSALIDQTKYSEAEKMLLESMIDEKAKNIFSLKARHKIVASGFNALNHFARCQIEEIGNTLNIDGKKKTELLTKVENALNSDNIHTMRRRKQRFAENDAYKHLGEIYKLLSKGEEKAKNQEKCIRNLTLFLSNGNTSRLDDFVSDPKMESWVNSCEDIDVLESYSEVICSYIKNSGCNSNFYDNVLLRIKEKMKKECDDRNEPQRSERVITIINRALGKEKCSFLDIDTIKKRENLFPDAPEKPTNEEKSRKLRRDEIRNRDDIRHRLDSNEKKFDHVLFQRCEMKDNHRAEVVVLRRWNSFTPGLFRKDEGEILGGGYLLRVNRAHLKRQNKDSPKVENIVIDPGYDFLQNFCNEGFHIHDIDAIIITHSHLDHCADLLPIMDLVYQINKRYDRLPGGKREQKRRINLCLSKGAYKKFSNYIADRDWQKQLKDVIIIENQPDMCWTPFQGLSIHAKQTNHTDLGG